MASLRGSNPAFGTTPTTAFKNGSLNTAKEAAFKMADAKQSRQQPLSQTQAHNYARSRRQSLVEPPKPAISAERLIDILLAAKSSLASVANAVNATGNVAEVTALLEDAVVTSTQTSFVTQGIKSQIRLLKQLRDSMLSTLELADADFKQILAHIEQANIQLRDRLIMLSQTAVHKALRPQDEETRTLLDFAEEENVKSIEQDLSVAVNELQDARSAFQNECDRFIADIQTLEVLIGIRPAPNATDKEKTRLSSAIKPHDPELTKLQTSAQSNLDDIATSLDSLSKHFDHCLVAVKSMPGALALARERAPEIWSQQHDSLDQMKPVTAQEFMQLISVVVEDSTIVDDTSAQINEQTRMIEQALAQMRDKLDDVQARYLHTLDAFVMLKESGARIHELIEAERLFTQRWALEKRNVRENLISMDTLTRCFDDYHRTYHALLVEADRRRHVEERIHHVWAKAREQVDRLMQLDATETERFRSDHGDSLPGDLWPDLDRPIQSFCVVPMNDSRNADTTRPSTTFEFGMPKLPGDLVELARKTMSGRGGKEKTLRERYA
ncbi:Autophagy-related protein 17 [Ceratocystis fimbriata CBS 114723]|uniref:Autophagy-related protein 17 n=1 Tax=Ceratocystis fimbriata CBS 114723 TaxID=1035309 RepID=A0A2C5WU91_9PEZI|nr:Autophagy-related protein 17 [Ceratocystis fimbriata CBS 114723]